MPLFIQITKPTPGEAPLAVRESWVGLIMPAVRNPDSTTPMYGLLSGKEIGPSEGYVVRWDDAMRALRQRPDALTWFQAQPNLEQRFGWLVFGSGNCIEVEAPVGHDHESAVSPSLLSGEGSADERAARVR